MISSPSFVTEKPANPYSRLFYCSALILLVVLAYGWSIFEPLSGDALMHVIDANRIRSGHDAWQRMLGHPLGHDDGLFRLDVFYRPVFNDFYISLLKYLFDVSPVYYRLCTLIIQCLAGLAIFRVFVLMRASDLGAFLGAVSLVLSPALFYGIYEFGLSFSQLLVLFAAISLYCASKFAQATTRFWRILHGIATLIFTVLVVFTKESAALWPFAVITLIHFAQLSWSQDTGPGIKVKQLINKSVSILRKNFPLYLLLALVTVLYFSVRYSKFGSLTAVAAGIEGSVTVSDSLKKLLGYILFAVGVPTEIFPPYFSAPISQFPRIEVIARLVLAMLFAFFSFRLYRKNKYLFAFALISAFLTFLPIVKVTRNAPYYGDLMSISFAFLIAFGFSVIRPNGRKWPAVALASVLVACLAAQSAFMSHRYIYNESMWLARAQGYARAAMADFAAIRGVPDSAKIVQIGNLWHHETIWSLHHGTQGSSFYSNLGVPTSRFAFETSAMPAYDNVLFIDIRGDTGFRHVGNSIFPGFGSVESAYFPGKLVKTAVKAENGVYDVRSKKMLRLRCDRVANGTEMTMLLIGFNLAGGETIQRMLESSYNVSKDSNDFVAEFIVPPSADTLFFVNPACSNPVVESYKSAPPSIDDFQNVVSKDSSFQQPDAWTGKLQRSTDGGVLVGPGPGAPNVLFQVVPVTSNYSYLVKAAVRRDDGAGQGRLQVNWHTANDTYLSTSTLVFQPTKVLQEFSLLAKAPSNAAKAVVYAAPHGEHDTVVYKSISMMSALPKQ